MNMHKSPPHEHAQITFSLHKHAQITFSLSEHA